MKTGLSTGLCILGLALAGSARAQPPADSGAASPTVEIDRLSAALEEEKRSLASELQAADCEAACAALASMQRAAARICELDPGSRCDRARRDVEEARERVLQACPDCIAANLTDERQQQASDKPDDLEEKDGDAPRPAPEPERDAEVTAAEGPPAADARGGCAACAVGEPRPDGYGRLAWLALAALALGRRRRGRRRT